MSHDQFSEFSSTELHAAASSKVFHTMLDTIPVAVMFLKAVRNQRNSIDEFNYTFANRAAERIAAGRLTGSILLYEHDPTLFSKMVSVVDSSIPQSFTHRYRNSDSWFNYTLTKFDDGVLLTSEDITAGKRNEIRLITEMKRLAQVQATGKIGFFDYDLENETILWTDEMYRIHGLEAQSQPMTKELFYSLIHQDDQPKVRKKMDAFRRTPGSDEFAMKLKLRNGDVKHLFTRIESFRDEDGRISHIVGMTMDISERKNAEEELARVNAVFEKQLRSKSKSDAALNDFERIVASSHDAVVSLDRAGIIQTWNSSAEKIFGYTADEAIGRKLSKVIVSDENVAAVSGLMKKVFSGESITDFDTTKKCRDGSKIEVLVNIVPLFDVTGKITGAAATIKNITPFRKAEKLTAIEKLKYDYDSDDAKFIHGLALASPDILFVMDLGTYEVLYTNRSIAETLGYSEKQIKAMKNPILDIMHEADRPEMLRHLAEFVSAKDDEVREIEYRLVHADGRICWFRDRNTVFKRNAEGIPTQKLGICHNVNARKTGEEKIDLLNNALKDKNRELLSLNSELRTFTSIMASHYKETLQMLYTNLEYIISNDARNFSNNGKANLRKAQTSIQKMKLLTDDIIAFSKIQTLDLQPSQVDLNVIIKNVREELDGKISEAIATFDVQKLPTITGYPLLLDLLFFHIIDNAIKFRRDGHAPKISISHELAEVDGRKQNLIAITDDGVGVADEDNRHLFDMFYRSHDRRFKGSGIGLAICRKIMDQHKGQIKVKDNGTGTVVICSFPG